MVSSGEVETKDVWALAELPSRVIGTRSKYPLFRFSGLPLKCGNFLTSVMISPNGLRQ